MAPALKCQVFFSKGQQFLTKKRALKAMILNHRSEKNHCL